MTQRSRSRARVFLRSALKDKRLLSLWLNTLSFLEYMGARKIAKALRQDYFNEELLGHLSEEARHSLFFKKLAVEAGGMGMGFRPAELIAGHEARAYFQKLDLKAMELALMSAKGVKSLRPLVSEGKAADAPSSPPPPAALKPGAGKSFQKLSDMAPLLDRQKGKALCLPQARADSPASPPRLDDSPVQAASESKGLLNYLLTTWIIEKRALSLYGDFDELLKVSRPSFSLSFVLREEHRHIQSVEGALKRGWPDSPRMLSLLKDFEEHAFSSFLSALEEALQHFDSKSQPRRFPQSLAARPAALKPSAPAAKAPPRRRAVRR